ncbi:Gfo/Idh/MocA family oxidoreductase [Microbispora sp. RL4-1S]|uniref:Gfo/Idh/MocA family oxidoreductase n=1 Tax=Microbispora oryzae TaxID=2806554 RepID=A0A940WJP5_9ACTN|nr:Gfo/Idh/MocA family oxidoreductase [Microbispora oryzae]MBP2702780.1 Gfo/Idh/MocA family oxidoreductase [Microbispora oryzae]
MKVAIAGFGTAGAARLIAYRGIPGAEVVAVADPSPRGREQAAREGLRAYESLAGLLASHDVDVVDVCAPPAFHRELSLGALAAGRHVICEKPVAFRAADAREMARAARSAGRLLYPAHNYGFSPMMRLLTEAAQTVGSPATALFRIQRQTHARGVGEWSPDWRRDPGIAGGGILLDHGSHCVYMATRLFGGRPGKVSATARWQAEGMEEAIDVHLSFPGGTADIELSWVGDSRTNRYALAGPGGSLDLTDGVAVLTGPGGREERELESPTQSSTHEEWFADMFADFAALAERPDRWARPLDEILSTAQIIEAAYASARLDGQPVTLQQG